MKKLIILCLLCCPTFSAYSGEAEDPLATLWATWNDRKTQSIPAFKIFDNLYYVCMEWVAAYVLVTDKGLVVIDALYGDWVDHLINGMVKLGLDPKDISYVLVTHGHFDHAGGAKVLQDRYGAKVLMSAEDLALSRQPAQDPRFAFGVPSVQVVDDGYQLDLGDNRVTFFKTPGHTTGVLTTTYQVRDGNQSYQAMTLGGVGLNFSGVARTESYLKSYARIKSMQDKIQVSLPNHAAMGRVFQRGKQLKTRQSGEPHPFVDPVGFTESIAGFIALAEKKLEDEKAGRGSDPLEVLQRTLQD